MLVNRTALGVYPPTNWGNYLNNILMSVSIILTSDSFVLVTKILLRLLHLV